MLAFKLPGGPMTSYDSSVDYSLLLGSESTLSCSLVTLPLSYGTSVAALGLGLCGLLSLFSNATRKELM